VSPLDIAKSMLELAVGLAAALGATDDDIVDIMARAQTSRNVITSALTEDRLADKGAANGK